MLKCRPNLAVNNKEEKEESKSQSMLLNAWAMSGFQEQFLQEQKLWKMFKTFSNSINAKNIFLLCICICIGIQFKHDL